MSTVPPNLAEVVMQRVANRTGRRVRNLSVEIGNQLLILRGRAGSYHVKQLAQQAVRETLPNATLENAIVVE